MLVFACMLSCHEPGTTADGEDTAKPWVFWYWMQASVSREGITADLEAMKAAGIGGAYLMPIKGPADPPWTEPPVVQLSPAWWDMVKHAFSEAGRLGLKLGMHASDGFALAGGPWITPELSMQKVVWTETLAAGGEKFAGTLPQPETNEDYYKDIAVLAFPTPVEPYQSTRLEKPTITTSLPDSIDAQFLADENSKETFRSEEPCWIQYEFDKPFLCRTVTIHTNGNNYQAQRLSIEASADGKLFKFIGKLNPPRHGWQDNGAPVSYSIRPAMARYFRFVFDRRGSEPGAEDLDAAKWKPVLKVRGIELSGSPRIHQYEGKNGSVWRIGTRTQTTHVPDYLCVDKGSIIDVTEYMDARGRLNWDVPAGHWTILRIGHTSTGHTNYTGGGGLGLECDKFNPEAARIQFENWFGEAVKQVGPELAAEVLSVFHVDSWECGSQNWSPVFREEFKKRRGYDLYTYLPVMAGIPVQSTEVSERFLHDVRQTIAELVHDNFYGTMATLAHEQGCVFSAESVAPTMVSDGMLHYDKVDVPMGEFWLHSPTHDKPNDMLDAVSGAHIYGRQIVQAEAFTTLRMTWGEHPAMLKALGDRNYALGANRFVYHVFTHNPWTDRKPGMTLDGVGLYFQRDQTWWKPGRAWVEYATRCQALLQQGNPVADIAVFTGEEVPRRALLPDRLVATLPGIFGDDRVKSEQKRLLNEGQPLREQPDGVTHAANMADPEDWTDPLNGYAYDSFNKDALLRLAKVRNGRIVLPGGASYALLVIPGAHPMLPDRTMMTPEVAKRLLDLVAVGATVLIDELPTHAPGLTNYPACDQELQDLVAAFEGGYDTMENNILVKKIGKGRIVKGPYRAGSFRALGIEPDLVARNEQGRRAKNIAWTHRVAGAEEIYFISNQRPGQRTIELSLRGTSREPELYDPVFDLRRGAATWRMENGRTVLPVTLPPNGSLFVILGRATYIKNVDIGPNQPEPATVQKVAGTWQVAFDHALGGPAEPVTFRTLADWSAHSDTTIRYYSGTATYTTSFQWHEADAYRHIWLDLGQVANLAEVYVNGVSCGVAWTPPYRVEITRALRPGQNKLAIDVTNTWANRLTGDRRLPEAQRVTFTTAPFRLEGKPLLPAGLLGPVTIKAEPE